MLWSLFLILATVVATYMGVIRPRQLTWGATRAEAERALLGDDIVAAPHFVATRTITIAAPPAEVWKWIVQIGSARAGWYSHDLIDNGNVPSALEILPQYQQIAPGSFIPFTPDQKNGMWVKDYCEPNHILWWDQKGSATWGWYLYPSGDAGTRLITRLRTHYDFSFPWLIYYAVYDFGDIFMMSKCMKGIKVRAERHSSRGWQYDSSGREPQTVQ